MSEIKSKQEGRLITINHPTAPSGLFPDEFDLEVDSKYVRDAYVEGDRLPFISVKALMQWGLNHHCGSVQATKFTNFAKAEIAKQNGLEGAKDVTLAMLKTYRERNEGIMYDRMSKHIEEAIKDLYEGKVTVTRTRQAPPTETEIEYLTRKIAYADAALKRRGVTDGLPADDSVVLQWPDGTTRTRSQMLANIDGTKVGQELWNQSVDEVKRRQEEAARKAAEAAAAMAEASEEVDVL